MSVISAFLAAALVVAPLADRVVTGMLTVYRRFCRPSRDSGRVEIGLSVRRIRTRLRDIHLWKEQ